MKTALGSRLLPVIQPGYGGGGCVSGCLCDWCGGHFLSLEVRVTRRPLYSPDALRLQGSRLVSSVLPSPKRSQSQLWYLLCDLAQVTEPLDLGLRSSLRPRQAVFQMTSGLGEQQMQKGHQCHIWESRAPESH